MINSNKKNEVLKSVLDKVKMQDAGTKEKEESPIKVSSSKKTYIEYPRLYVNAKQVPGLINYDVEDDIMLVVKGKIISHSKNERIGSLGNENFDIEIRKVGCEPKKQK